MTTTLNEARTAILRLSDQFPKGSTYAAHLAVLSDYFDNQVPLNVENRALVQRIAVLESAIDGVRKALPDDHSIVTITVSKITDANKVRRPIDCTGWMGPVAGPCRCPSCASVNA